MRRSILNLRSLVLLSCGLLLVPMPSIATLAHSSYPIAGQNGTVNSRGMSPNMRSNGPMAPPNNAQLIEATVSQTILKSIDTEIEFSRLALKRSNNAGIKKFARQVITSNQKIKEQLNRSASNNGAMPADPAPDGGRGTDRTRAATEKLEKLTGPQFDRLYLVQMDTYVRDDQQTGHSAYAMMDLPHLSQLGMQVWTLANDRSKQIAKLTGDAHLGN